MTVQQSPDTFAQVGGPRIFTPDALESFAALYPESGHRLGHRFHEHPLMTLESLARLADRLDPRFIECNLGEQPVGVEGPPPQLKEGVGDRIRNIETTASWVALREVDQDPEYRALLESMLDDIRPAIEATTGPVLTVQGYIFVTSPGGVTPFHFDPEHNILFQMRGSKVFTQFPAGDPFYAADECHERYHAGGQAELPWRDEMAGGGREWHLGPGDAFYVPVMAPHFVRNGPEVSISLSVTWRSEWSYAEADARCFNRMARGFGLSPAAPPRWPRTPRAKSLAFRAIRRLGLANY